MKILYISQRYYPHVGGVEYVVKSIAERLAKRGHEIIVVSGEQGIEKPQEEFINGVHVIRWPVWSPSGAYHIPRIRDALKDMLREHVRTCDVVHFHNVHSVLSVYSLDILKNDSVHKVLTPYYHGTGHTTFRKVLWPGWRLYIRRLLKHVDVVHTVSKTEAKLVRKDLGSNAIPIENGVEEWLQSVGWRPLNYAMFSGRIERYKNIHRLANIVKILNEEHGLNLELRIYGNGPYVNDLRKHLHELEIRWSVSPSQPFENYIKTLSQASFFGLLSEKESYPQSVNEANAIGVPVIIAKPWGLNFRDRSRTLIVDLGESDREIARKVAAFLERVQDQPKSEVPSWSKVVDLYVKRLYKDALFQ